MYLQHFNLSKMPFAITPNIEFYQGLKPHEEALNTLLVGIKTGEGFIKITGEVGTGKTMLCRLLLTKLGDNYKPIYIYNPCLTSFELFKTVANELKIIIKPGVERKDIIDYISAKLIEHHNAGKKIVLIIDEAQALPKATLEALRLLTNLETEDEKLLQIVLCGQTELDETLNEKSMRQVKQRVVFHYELKPLTLNQVARYLKQRLKCAGIRKNIFTNDAIKNIYYASGGIPRIINILAHKSLMVAFGKGEKTVNARHVIRAVADTEIATKTLLKDETAFDYKLIVAGGTVALVLGVMGSIILSTLPF